MIAMNLPESGQYSIRGLLNVKKISFLWRPPLEHGATPSRSFSHPTRMAQAGIVRPASFSYRFQSSRPIASRYSAAYDYRFMLTARPHSFTSRVLFALAFCAFADLLVPGFPRATAQESREILPLQHVRPGMQGYA